MQEVTNYFYEFLLVDYPAFLSQETSLRFYKRNIIIYRV